MLQRKNFPTARSVFRLWSIVLCSNLVRTYLFVLCVAKVAIFTPHIQETLAQVSREAPAGFWTVLVRAIFAGWRIALMVWLLRGAESAPVSITTIVNHLIGVGGFNHIIAGSNKVFFLVASGQESWLDYLTHFFLPRLFGNIIGGVSLVAFLGHAQVVAGKQT